MTSHERVPWERVQQAIERHDLYDHAACYPPMVCACGDEDCDALALSAEVERLRGLNDKLCNAVAAAAEAVALITTDATGEEG